MYTHIAMYYVPLVMSISLLQSYSIPMSVLSLRGRTSHKIETHCLLGDTEVVEKMLYHTGCRQAIQ